MKLYNFVSLVILSTLILSCTFDQNSTYDVTYSKYKNKIFKEVTMGFRIDSVFNSSRKLFQYYNEDSSLLYRLDINLDFDTIITFNGETILKKGNKQFIDNDRIVDIYKYYYDINGQQDEEAYVFINYEYGIVGINYFPWNYSVFPEVKNALEGIKDTLLKSENESFYQW